MSDSRLRFRIALLVAVVCASAVAIGARLYQIQVVRADDLRARAEGQHQRKVEVHGHRGAILDRNHRELAVSIETQSLYAHPQRFDGNEARSTLTRELAPILGLPRKSVAASLGSDSPFVWVKRRLDPGTVQRIKQLGHSTDGSGVLGFETEAKRFYPNGKLGVHLIGFSNIDQQGVEGLEKRYDELLRSDPTTYLAVRDGRGGAVRHRIQSPTKRAEDIVLTLDVVIQHIVERELARAMRQTGSKSGSVVVLEPSTGHVLALANWPWADPNVYGRSTPTQRRNRAVSDFYEPGSTFKIVTAAAALDMGKVRPGQRFDCERGSTRVAGQRIGDYKPFGVLTFRQIIQKSSNIGILKVGTRLPRESFHDYITRFGFGRTTGIELPGESFGLLHPLERWNALSPASISFGHEIGVTVLQMASAFATVANDGVRVPPRLVLGRRDPDGRFVPIDATAGTPVLRPETARLLTDILEGVVTDGTGGEAAVAGYSIAGKTGTAQKVLGTGGYSDEDYVASFGGYGPVRGPRLAVMVALDSPRGIKHQGGSAAAPVFRRIMRHALDYLRVPPDQQPARVTAAVLEPDPLPVVGSGDGAPPARERGARQVRTTEGQVPDLRGYSMREAIGTIADRGYRARIVGRGVVVSQSPAPGSRLDPGETCTLRLSTARGTR